MFRHPSCPPLRCPEFPLSFITLHSDRLRLTIRPDLGAGIASLALRGPDDLWHPVLRPAPPHTGNSDELACFLLAPWSNRIAAASFRWNNRDYALTPNGPDLTAIHGDVRHRPFSILDRSPVSARLARDAHSNDDRNWPWPYRVSARYEIDDSSLSCDLSLTNLADEPFPAGIGFHPFWQRRLWDERDLVHLQAHLPSRYPLHNKLPAGPPNPDPLSRSLSGGISVPTNPLDEAFLGSLHSASLFWPASRVLARFGCSPVLSHTILYIPSNNRDGTLPWFCLEPVSHVNNAINISSTGVDSTGIQILQPGLTLHARWFVHFHFNHIS